MRAPKQFDYQLLKFELLPEEEEDKKSVIKIFHKFSVGAVVILKLIQTITLSFG